MFSMAAAAVKVLASEKYINTVSLQNYNRIILPSICSVTSLIYLMSDITRCVHECSPYITMCVAEHVC